MTIGVALLFRGVAVGIDFAFLLQREPPIARNRNQYHAQNRRPLTPADVFYLLRAYPLRWLMPTMIIAILAAVFTAVWPRSWVANQGLIVRNAATDAQRDTPGKFRLDNELKVTLETILEIARSRGVLEFALREVGAPAEYRVKKNHPFPNAEDVADLRDVLKLTPPKGQDS